MGASVLNRYQNTKTLTIQIIKKYILLIDIERPKILSKNINCFLVAIINGSKNGELLNFVSINLCEPCEKINVSDFGFPKQKLIKRRNHYCHKKRFCLKNT